MNITWRDSRIKGLLSGWIKDWFSEFPAQSEEVIKTYKSQLLPKDLSHEDGEKSISNKIAGKSYDNSSINKQLPVGDKCAIHANL